MDTPDDMPFALISGESPPSAVDRLLREQLAGARLALDHPDRVKAVHQARKCGKRARAVLALVAHDLPKQGRKLRRAVRDAAQLLGPIRDADVMEVTLASLEAPIAEAGLALLAEARPTDVHERLQAARAGLDRAVSLAEKLDTSKVDAATLRLGLQRSYDAAREHLAEVRVDPDSEVVHDWRKTVKAWGYHLELVVPRARVLLEPWRVQVDALQELLGDHHDHAVLEEFFADVELAAPIREAARERQAVLARDAITLGESLLVVPARTWARFVSEAATL